MVEGLSWMITARSTTTKRFIGVLVGQTERLTRNEAVCETHHPKWLARNRRFIGLDFHLSFKQVNTVSQKDALARAGKPAGGLALQEIASV